MTRRRELDSLRGLAALSVLMFHALATDSAAFALGFGLGDVPSPVVSVLTYSPLHIAWVGGEAVFLFFVLSGFVLMRSTMGRAFSWEAYYTSRMARLYLPVLFAVLLTWLVYQLVDHNPSPLNGEAVGLVPASYPAAAMLYDMTLLGGASEQLGVLWSLQWEVVFSLALPVFIYLARRHALASCLIGLAVCLLGWQHNVPAPSYLPMFLLGVVLAQYWDRLETAFRFLDEGRRGSTVWGAVLFVLSITAITSYFMLGRGLSAAGLPPRVWTLPLVLFGIALLLVVVQVWSPLRRLLSMRAFTALGMISFSLYLVHRPIVIAFAFHFHLGARAAVAGVVTSLLVAVPFYWLVERPTHRLSRRVAEVIRARATEPPAIALATATTDG